MFTDAEYQSGTPVCVLGETVREELFGAEDPVGASDPRGHRVRAR